ncbi:MAG: HEPN domain-containing protein [Blastochloris sp.]|nr:HEPN domain-containing protein [Blastochloris sp.]
MSSPDDLVRGWLLKGDSDLATARLVADSTGPYDTACFHAQQAAEKYLKGFLTHAGIPFPFTHNLEELELRGAAANPRPDFSMVDLTILTPYAVQLRYDPDFWPDQAAANEALNLAGHVRAAILAVLPTSTHP